MKTKPIVWLPAAVFLAVLCSKQAPQPKSQGKVVCLLCDLSESTNKPEIRKSYQDYIRMVLDGTRENDVLLASPITEKSIAERYILRHAFPDFSTDTDNPLYQQAQRKKFDLRMQAEKDSLFGVITGTLFDPSLKIVKTDITSSLSAAQAVFESFAEKKRVLVILSDMIEDSESYDFEKENLTDARIREIIRVETEKGRLPSLAGVHVHVAGAAAEDKEHFFKVRKFWMEYFKACKATLLNANYGTGLITFTE
ncbi:hypothetical protein JW906_00225 [bacterium]|nr:hypothetical protein [bacterium]